ncbi:MAG: phosphatase PAP2 family protein [Desulfobacterota bacterium]|nr:phosphatase PAP2 family protein [Thermodesulfobacteriota bacterium]
MDWELQFMRWANGWWSSPLLDHLLPWLTHLGSHLAVIALLGLSLVLPRQRKAFPHLLSLYGIQLVVIYGLKFLVQRQRPLHFLPEIGSKLSFGPGEILDPSFPSAHSALGFMMAAFFSQRYPRYAIVFYILAGFIAWSRLYLGLHYPTDILAGVLLGYGISKGLFYYLKRKGKEIYRSENGPS